MYLTVLAQKGAQTKTTTSVNLAAALSATRPGILVDVDFQQCDATKYQGSIPGVEWTSEVPEAAPDGGFVVVDTPPQIVDVTGEALLRSDVAIIPCTTQLESLESLARTFQTIELARQKNERLFALIVFTCVDRSQYAQGIIEAARVLAQWPVTKAKIPERKMDLQKAFAARRPVLFNSPKSGASVAYRELTAEILSNFHDGTA